MTSVATPRAHHAAALDWPFRDRADARKRQANEYMRNGLHRLDPNEPIPFFCECRRSDCFAVVWLGSGAYDRLRGESSGHVLAPAHRTGVVARSLDPTSGDTK